MAFSVKILADSLAPCGARLTTFEVTYPRPIHSEILTHKALSRNSASSRAIPVEKLIRRVIEDPWVPSYIGANQKGMQPGDELTEFARQHAVNEWLMARDRAVERAEELVKLRVHKGVVNRLLEPWMWITVIISATTWDNFYGLRCHKDAEPHFQHLARHMRDAAAASTPRELAAGRWHLPLIDDGMDRHEVAKIAEIPRGPGEDDAALDRWLCKVSVGRVARVSYLTHDGKRDLREDIGLHDRMMVQDPLHASPAEHVAQAMDWPEWFKRDWRGSLNLSGSLPDMQNKVLEWRRVNADNREAPPQWVMVAETVLAQMRSGNFMGFGQYRKLFSNEHIGGLMP